MDEVDPDWDEFLSPIWPQFLQLSSENGALELYNLKLKVKQKSIPNLFFYVRVIELLADNKALAKILSIKEPPAYNCCSKCKIKVIMLRNKIELRILG